MAELPQSCPRSSTSSRYSFSDGEEVGSSFSQPESPRDRSSAMAVEEPQTRRGIRRRRRSSSSSNSNSNGCSDNVPNRKNPFELEPEQLSERLCSPSLFQVRSPEAAALSRSFSRPIDQMADFFSIDIEEEELSYLQAEESCHPFQMSQQTIDPFFSAEAIVPSPCEPSSRVRSPTPAAEVVGANSGVQPERKLHTATMWSQMPLAVPPMFDLSTVLGDYDTFHATQNRQSAREGITGRRSVRRRLFCSVIEEEPTNEIQGCQPLSPITDDAMEGPSSMRPLHMVPHSSPMSDSGFMRLRWSQGSDLGDEIWQLSPINRRAGTGPLLEAATPSDEWSLKLSEGDEHFLFADRNVNDRSFDSLPGFDTAIDVRELTDGVPPNISALSPCSSEPRRWRTA